MFGPLILFFATAEKMGFATNKVCCCIVLDIKKAFDTIDHERIFIEKSVLRH